MIIDAHAHLGYDEVFDEDFTQADLLQSQSANGIDITLVQPALTHDLTTAQHYHDAIAELARRYPGRFYGVANPSPHLSGGRYEAEVRRCVCELGFVGVKLHPFAHAVNPLGHSARRAFATAAELGVPIMVHTGAGLPWSAPSLLMGPAKDYPTLSIIAAHAGQIILAGEAELLAGERTNVFLECSWTGGFLVRHWVRKFGPQRILFGSDHTDNAATELAKFRSSALTPEELDETLGRAAARLFRLPRERDV